MKWLLLILIVACGHEQPPAKDVADSDGDHVLNYEEKGDELQKYTANVRPFGEIKASLTFRKELSLITLDLSNESNLSQTSYRLLTKRAKLMKVEDHFSEWSKMRLSGPVPEGDFSEKAYEFTLRFSDIQDRPDFLELNGANLGDFRPVMKFHLSGAEVVDLLKGRSHIILKRKSDVGISENSTIRQRTYRVFWNDGHVTQVFYVSKDLPFMQFVSLKKIGQVRNADELDGLGWNGEHQDWWYREIGDSDKVLIRASEKDVAEARGINFHRTESEVQRVNGVQAKDLNLSKAPEARVILKIRGVKELRTFTERREKFYRGGGHEEGRLTCYSYHRDISSANSINLSSEEIIQQLRLSSDSKFFSQEELVQVARESADEKGPYLEIHLGSSAQNIQLSLPTRPNGTFTKTGVYQSYCETPRDMKYGGVDSNEEGHFSLKIDTFIEKLED